MKGLFCGLMIVMMGLFAFPVIEMDSVEAATKVGKVTGSGASVLYGKRLEPGSHSQLYWNQVWGAKKYQIYKSKKMNKGYKKVRTRKDCYMNIKTPKGLECYKVRAIKGKKKGKFSPVAIAYGFKMSVVDVLTPSGFNGTVFKIKIYNTAKNSKRLTLYNPKREMLFNSFDTNSGDELEDSTGYYSKMNGEKIKQKTIKAKTTGYVYYAVKSRNAGKYYYRAMDSSKHTEINLGQSYFIKIGKHKKHFANEQLQITKGVTNNSAEYDKNLW